MKLPDLTQINDQSLFNIQYYSYKHLNTFVNTSITSSRYSWHLSNLLGEMYEHLVYEKLLIWANDSNEVSEFVLKGPYIKRDPSKKDGLVYDSNKQIFYMSSGETIGEFDALFRCGKYRYFVEITQTENRPIIKALEYGILRKYNLMRILFPHDEIGCWVITTYQGKISTDEVSDFKVLRTRKYKLNPDSLRATNQAALPITPKADKFQSVYHLQHKPFQFFRTLFRIHNQLGNTRPQQMKKVIRNLIEPFVGLIERVYIGKASADDFNRFVKDIGYTSVNNIQIGDAYLAVKIANDLSMKRTFYLRGTGAQYFELTDITNMTLKKIQKGKRSRKEIRRLDKSLKKLDSQELKQYWTAI